MLEDIVNLGPMKDWRPEAPEGVPVMLGMKPYDPSSAGSIWAEFARGLEQTSPWWAVIDVENS